MNRTLIRILLIVAAAALVVMFGREAQSRDCGSRTSVRFGETTADVARRCGVNPQALRDANPGLRKDRPPVGTSVQAPRPALPSVNPGRRGNPALTLPRSDERRLR